MVNSTVYGQPITFVATVAAAGTPTGTVTFLDNGSALATVAVDGSGTATLTTRRWPLAPMRSPRPTAAAPVSLVRKSGPASESVAQARSAIVLVPHPVLKKKKVKSEILTAEIEPMAPGGGVPTGMATFELLTKKKKKIKTTVLGTAAVVDGDATLTVKPKLVLSKVITIVYSGDTDFVASTLTAPNCQRRGCFD